MVELRIVDNNDRDTWQLFCADAGGGHWTHSWGWRHVYLKAYSLETKYFFIYEEGAPIGIVPTVAFRGVGVQKKLFSLPFLDYAGPVFPDGRELSDWGGILFRNTELSIRLMAGPIDSGSASAGMPVTMRLELCGDEETVWKGMNAKARNQVRKAAKMGVVVRSGKNLVDDFYAIWRRRMHALGTPAHSKKWFVEILREFDEATIFMAYKDSNPIGGAFFLGHQIESCVPWAAVEFEYRSTCANNLLYWEALKYSVTSGYRVFDFLRSQLYSGTYAFKKQWGAVPHKLVYSKYVDGKRTSLSHPGQAKPAILLSSIWRKLPQWFVIPFEAYVRRALP